MMFKDVCTIYNKSYDDDKGYEVYNRTVLSGVYWEERQGVNIAKSGMKEADKLLVLIPISVDVEGKLAMTAKAYARTSDKTNFWTLKPGDIIVKGEVTDEIDNIKTFGNLHDYYTLTTVDFMDFGRMGHWEVGAK